jgi:hypothetical protein
MDFGRRRVGVFEKKERWVGIASGSERDGGYIQLR